MRAAISFTSTGVRLSCQEIMGRARRSRSSRKIPQQRWADREKEAMSEGFTPLCATALAMASMVASTSSSASCSTQPGLG